MTREEKAAYQKAYYIKNKERMDNQNKLNSQKESRKEAKRIYDKERYDLNRDNIIAQKVAYRRKRLDNDLNFKITHNLRGRFSQAIKRESKTDSAVKDLGCSISSFKDYISSKFTEGMSWDNYGEWHFDHIKPLSSFDLSNREQLLEAVHYTNIQPLWALDNLRKGSVHV